MMLSDPLAGPPEKLPYGFERRYDSYIYPTWKARTTINVALTYASLNLIVTGPDQSLHYSIRECRSPEGDSFPCRVVEIRSGDVTMTAVSRLKRTLWEKLRRKHQPIQYYLTIHGEREDYRLTRGNWPAKRLEGISRLIGYLEDQVMILESSHNATG